MVDSQAFQQMQQEQLSLSKFSGEMPKHNDDSPGLHLEERLNSRQ
jgi:hypothetical protein